MQRLSGLDASFLYLETPGQPMHVSSVIEIDPSTMPGGYTFDRLRDALSLRIKGTPQLREKLADSPLNLDHPVWVDDNDFDIDRHLHLIELPPPGGRAELSKICGHLAAQPLDRRRPLWEMWVIEGVAAGPDDDHEGDPEGRMAVMLKVHHAGIDGVSGTDLISQLCATEADAPAPDPIEGVGGGGSWQIAASGLVRFVSRPLKLVNVVPDTLSSVIATLRRARDGRTMERPFAAPRTVFNARISERRAVAYTQLDLEDIKTVKGHFGVKVNDVVMALVAGVIRQYLLERNSLPDSPLVAGVPVSVHGRSDRPGRNQISAMFASLQTHLSDPADRLKAIAESNSIAKQHSSALGATLVQDWLEFAAPAVLGTAMRLIARAELTDRLPVHNLVISNVAGPQFPLYLLGCEVQGMYPLSPIFQGTGLSITVLSLNGHLDVGLIGCPKLLPDLWDMADQFAPAMQELLAAVGSSPRDSR